MLALERLEAHRLPISGTGQARIFRQNEVIGTDLLAFAEDESALNDIPELADVAGPAVAQELFLSFLCHFLGPASRGIVGDEEIHQGKDVVCSLPQGRNQYVEDIQAVEEIFSELLRLDSLLQVPVCRGDDPDLDRDGRGAANPLEAALLEQAQELRLAAQCEFPDLVEKYRAAVSQLKAPFLTGYCPGKGSLFMTKKLALNQVFRQGSTVEGDEGSVAPLAAIMQGGGDQLFAGSPGSGQS